MRPKYYTNRPVESGQWPFRSYSKRSLGEEKTNGTMESGRAPKFSSKQPIGEEKTNGRTESGRASTLDPTVCNQGLEGKTNGRTESGRDLFWVFDTYPIRAFSIFYFQYFLFFKVLFTSHLPGFSCTGSARAHSYT